MEDEDLTTETAWQSGLVQAAPSKRTPADLLPERSSWMRRWSESNVTETYGNIPTIKALTKHAERYGSGQVVETAVELGYSFDACVRLAETCDRADLALLRKDRPRARLQARGTSESRVRALMGIKEEVAA